MACSGWNSESGEGYVRSTSAGCPAGAGVHTLTIGWSPAAHDNEWQIIWSTGAPPGAVWYGRADFMNDYFNCGSTSGNITFYASEGSETCGAYGSLPSILCNVEGDDYTISSSSSTETSLNATIPSYKDALEFEDGTWRISAWEEERGTDFNYMAMFKSADHISQLSFRPINGESVGTVDEWLGRGVTLGDTYQATIIRYNSPTGEVNNIPIGSVDMDTTLELNSLPCRDDIFGADAYNFDLIVGVNETHYKKSGYTCADGVGSSNAVVYGTTLAAVAIDSVGATLVGELETKLSDFAPMWVDTESNTFNRFIYVNLIFEDGARDINEYDMLFGDNENFLLSFNYTEQSYEYVVSDSYPYGEHYYSCVIPAGYIAVSNSSGYITIDEPMEHVSVIVQEVKEMNLQIWVNRQGSPAVGALCTADLSFGAVSQTNSEGMCAFVNVAPDSVISVDIIHGGDIIEAEFSISDYYNSDGYGDGEICASFDGNYTYTIDLEGGSPFEINVLSAGEGFGVENAWIYWDGALVGSTNNLGKLMFFVDWEFTDHELVVSQSEFINGSATVRLTDSPYTIKLIGIGEYDDNQKAFATKTRSDFLTMFSSMAFLGLLIIIAVSFVGFRYAGMPGGAASAAMAAVLLALTGMLPWSWAALIVFLGLVIGIGGSGGGIVSMFSGGRR